MTIKMSESIRAACEQSLEACVEAVCAEQYRDTNGQPMGRLRPGVYEKFSVEGQQYTGIELFALLAAAMESLFDPEAKVRAISSADSALPYMRRFGVACAMLKQDRELCRPPDKTAAPVRQPAPNRDTDPDQGSSAFSSVTLPAGLQGLVGYDDLDGVRLPQFGLVAPPSIEFAFPTPGLPPTSAILLVGTLVLVACAAGSAPLLVFAL